MSINNRENKKIKKEIKEFDNLFEKEVKEIIILTGNSGSSAGRAGYNELWTASQRFIAYIDCETGELNEVENDVRWLAANDQRNGWIYNLQAKTIYNLKVRKIYPKFGNQFMLVDVIERDLSQEDLAKVLEEYEKPVIIVDEKCGTFELNKEFDFFEGESQWLKGKALIYLDSDVDNQHTANDALNTIQKIIGNKEVWDKKIREFAAEKLVDLANDWLESDEYDNPQEITKESFIERIRISELAIHIDGEFTAYYNDDDIFWGHIITLIGNVNGDLSDAYIEG